MSKLRIKNDYGVTPNSVLNNVDLSFKAKGLYGYIQSKPDGWDFSAERISNDSKDGVDSIYAGLNELAAYGFLERVKYQNELGHWEVDYILHIEPYPGFSLPGKALNNIKKEDSNKELLTSIDVSSEKNSHIEEKNPKKPTKSKRSSFIREGTDAIRATYVPPTKEHIDEVLGKKRGVDKFYEILTLENMKDTKIFELDNPEDPLTFTKLISLYEWMVMFFQEKYDGKIYKDNEGKMVGSNIILNELDKFIAYYAEKPDEHILDLKARLRKWITNSLKYSV